MTEILYFDAEHGNTATVPVYAIGADNYLYSGTANEYAGIVRVDWQKKGKKALPYVGQAGYLRAQGGTVYFLYEDKLHISTSLGIIGFLMPSHQATMIISAS